MSIDKANERAPADGGATSGAGSGATSAATSTNQPSERAGRAGPTQSETPNVLAPGTVIAGRYRIDDVLGSGGMGTVYRASQLGLGRAVALKVIRPEYATNASFRMRFEREARVMAALDHPNAVKVYDYGVDNDISWFAMELLIGVPLSHIVARGSLTETTAASIGCAVCDVLCTTHALRLVHRDLKPENLFVLDRGTDVIEPDAIRVVDFGIAFIEDAGDMGRLTRNNQVLGTPTYLSPEHAAGRTPGPAADLYALGVILFEMVAGVSPFLGDAGEVIAKHIYQSAPTVASMRAAPVDPRFEEIVALLLKKDPDSRPTAQDALAALRAIAQGSALPVDLDRAARMVAGAGGAARHLARTELFGVDPTTARVRHWLHAKVQLPDAVHIALATEGIGVLAPDQHNHPADVVVLSEEEALSLPARTGGSDEPIRLATLNAPGTNLPALIRAQVDDVIPLPYSAPDVARRVARALRRAGRGPQAGP